MADVTGLAMVTGVSTLVNTVSTVSRGKDPIVTVVGGAIGFVGLALFGGLTNRYDLATAIAWVFLVGALVFRGLPLITGAGKLATGAKSAPKSKAGSSQAGGSTGKGYSGGGGGGGGRGGV